MNNTKKLLVLLLALVMVVGLFAACGSEPANPNQPANNDETQGSNTDDTQGGNDVATDWNGEPVYGGHMNMHIYSKPDGLDPAKNTGTWKDPWATCIWENALTRDADNNIAPGVCNFELSDDNLTLKLWVRDNCYFNDGTEVDIYDVEASLNRHFTGFAANATKYVGKYIQSMTIDENEVMTIVFKSYHEKTMYYMAAYKTWLGIMPKEICEKYAEAPILDQYEDCIGTGPYKVVDYEDGVQITVAKNEYYVPREDEGQTGFAAPKVGYLDSITFWYNSDNSSATLALLNGDYDLTDVVDIEYMEMAEQKGIKRDVYPSFMGVAVTFNTMGSTNVCAKYPDVRKAVMAAIDYEEYLSVVCDDAQVLGGSMVIGDEYDSDLWEEKEWFGEANQDVVDQYLEAAYAAGYNDQPVQIVYNTTRDDIPTLLCQYMDDAGINYELTTMEQSVYNAFIGDPGNNWDLYFGWPTYAFTPGTLSDGVMRNNYRSEEKDAVLEAMEVMTVGSDEYMAKWEELSAIMAEDCSVGHMGVIDWIWYHPATLHTDHEGMFPYVYNYFWEDPQNHPSQYAN